MFYSVLGIHYASLEFSRKKYCFYFLFAALGWHSLQKAEFYSWKHFFVVVVVCEVILWAGKHIYILPEETTWIPSMITTKNMFQGDIILS